MLSCDETEADLSLLCFFLLILVEEDAAGESAAHQSLINLRDLKG